MLQLVPGCCCILKAAKSLYTMWKVTLLNSVTSCKVALWYVYWLYSTIKLLKCLNKVLRLVIWLQIVPLYFWNVVYVTDVSDINRYEPLWSEIEDCFFFFFLLCLRLWVMCLAVADWSHFTFVFWCFLLRRSRQFLEPCNTSCSFFILSLKIVSFVIALLLNMIVCLVFWGTRIFIASEKIVGKEADDE
jgi:hypothetical protein